MIGGTFVLIAVVALIVWSLQRGVDSAAKRWALAVVGVLTVGVTVLMVTSVPVRGPAVLIVELLVVQVLFIALIVAMMLVWSTSRLPRGPAPSWAQAHGVTLSDANRAFVESYVSEGHRLRVVCGFGGAIALASLSRGFGITIPVSGWVWLMGGYLVGVVWSESWLTRLPSGTRRSASLTPRRVRDYLVGRLLVAQIVVPLIALGVAMFGLVATGPSRRSGGYPDLEGVSASTLRWTTVLIGLGVLVLGFGVAALQRHVVTKPQPLADGDLLAADDAVRAASVHLLSGTSTGIALVCIGSQLRLLSADGLVSDGLATISGLVCWVAALIVWRYYGHRAWVVRRPDRSPVSPLPERVPS